MLLARVNPTAAAEHETKRHIFDIITVMFLFFVLGGIAELVLLPLNGCHHVYWFPMILESLNIILFSFFGWLAVASMILACVVACVILAGPFCLSYHILRGLFCPVKYDKVDTENPETS